MPAYYCGLFGHYPTADTTNMRGIMFVREIYISLGICNFIKCIYTGGTFRTGLEKNTMVSAGTVVKHAEDIAPLLKVLANEKAALLKLDAPVDLNKLKYYFVDHVGDKRCSNVQLSVKECMNKYVILPVLLSFNVCSLCFFTFLQVYSILTFLLCLLHSQTYIYLNNNFVINPNSFFF